MSEQKRGCGYRKIGGLYLVSDPGFQLECDGLPLNLEPCECCGFRPPFSRNLQRIHPAYIDQEEIEKHGGIRYSKDEYKKDCSCPEKAEFKPRDEGKVMCEKYHWEIRRGLASQQRVCSISKKEEKYYAREERRSSTKHH